MKFLELFAGSGVMSSVAKLAGMKTFSVDNQVFPNIDLVADVGTLTTSDIPFVPDAVWGSPDCTTYSIASISKHRNGTQPKTEYAAKCDKVNKQFLSLIRQWQLMNPKLIYFIENPRGMLRKMPFMDGLPRFTIWYCQYQDERAKPTGIWTNSKTWTPRPICKNGNPNCHHRKAPRGSKTGTQGRNGSYARSKLPISLCFSVIESLIVPDETNQKGSNS